MPSLSVVVTVVSGAAALRRCLAALSSQSARDDIEIIVPYDDSALEVAPLAGDFPAVRFHHFRDLGAAGAVRTARAHRLYDRRRAVGLALARGALVAMTEDHAVPASDWCDRIRAAHREPYAVIGGAIENAIDRPLHWALYYCDFGRYGRPLPAGPADYVSDVNVAYKRAALDAIRTVWIDAYHETTVHWALRARGEALILDPRMVVFEHRPLLAFTDAYRERAEWGRVFAETRAAAVKRWQRALYAAGTPLLPFLLLLRGARHMIRQGQSVGQMVKVLPLIFILLTGWAAGEAAGYVSGPAGGRAA